MYKLIFSFIFLFFSFLSFSGQITIYGGGGGGKVYVDNFGLPLNKNGFHTTGYEDGWVLRWKSSDFPLRVTVNRSLSSAKVDRIKQAIDKWNSGYLSYVRRKKSIDPLEGTHYYPTRLFQFIGIDSSDWDVYIEYEPRSFFFNPDAAASALHKLCLLDFSYSLGFMLCHPRSRISFSYVNINQDINNWNTKRNAKSSHSKLVFLTVILHELGHVLGLGHSDNMVEKEVDLMLSGGIANISGIEPKDRHFKAIVNEYGGSWDNERPVDWWATKCTNLCP